MGAICLDFNATTPIAPEVIEAAATRRSEVVVLTAVVEDATRASATATA